MAKYRKKPKIIEAEQYFDNYHPKGVCRCPSDECGSAPHVHTIHQNQAVRLAYGDFIVPEGDGEHYYPVKPQIFHESYELVGE